MGRRQIGWALVALGVIAMAAAAIWAPAQPEFLTTGGSCEISQCGMLEDPPRWRAAWWVWGTGLSLAVTGQVLAAHALQRGRRGVLWCLVALVGLPVWLVILTLPASILSWWTSMQGAFTVYAVLALLPLVALLSATVQSIVRRRVAPSS